MAPQLVGGHCYDEGNPMADLASRGRFEELLTLSQALGTTQQRLDLPAAAMDFLQEAAGRCRSLTAAEHGCGAAFPANVAGDGSAAGDEPKAADRCRALTAAESDGGAAFSDDVAGDGQAAKDGPKRVRLRRGVFGRRRG
ncbi:hypothetical protein M885DRAFT_541867 [Pelagophyceae sp. CCMP2097]|nr:hypothetical protein M885DRAFT_541867 [Pelagophyceae sp. CCMP2097]